MNATKQVVHYSEIAPTHISEGSRVFLVPIAHPDTTNVTNGNLVYTSPVVSYEEETGIIETANTVYVPA